MALQVFMLTKNIMMQAQLNNTVILGSGLSLFKAYNFIIFLLGAMILIHQKLLQQCYVLEPNPIIIILIPTIDEDVRIATL
ncbi:hypothetical protein AMS62_09340 [Bacillus sp. FJAT-18019]|nr:hypothetical protein AMS62_09340 [Bacillus sp. FJAT-18019]